MHSLEISKGEFTIKAQGVLNRDFVVTNFGALPPPNSSDKFRSTPPLNLVTNFGAPPPPKVKT